MGVIGIRVVPFFGHMRVFGKIVWKTDLVDALFISASDRFPEHRSFTESL